MYKHSRHQSLQLIDLKFGEHKVVVGEVMPTLVEGMQVVGKRYLKARAYMLL
jgi:hypothetical protein